MNPHQQRNQVDKKKMRPQRPLLIILEDLDFAWDHEEVEAFIALYKQGCSLELMAKKLRPGVPPKDAQHETELLAMHLERKNRI